MTPRRSHVLSPLAADPPRAAAAAPGHSSVRGGELGELMRRHDWSCHPLGPPERWPRSLRGYVAMILEMPTAAIIFWGPDQIQLYNDGYAAIMGPRHPRYFAAPYRECWPETYPVIYPWMRAVLDQGETIHVTDELITLTRHGFPEEAYFTFTFSPLRDDEERIAGILQPVVEVTASVLGERRSRTVSLLAARSESRAGALAVFREALEANPRDIPFHLLFLADEEGDLTLASWSGFPGSPAAPPEVGELAAMAAGVVAAGTQRTVDDLEAIPGWSHRGTWPEPTRSAIVLPVGPTRDGGNRGALVLGLSPRLQHDDRYRELGEQICRQLAVSLAGAEARGIEAHLLAREQTARREAELQKEHLAALLTQAPTPMLVLRGPDLVVELANPSTCQLWQRQHAEVIDRPLFEVLPELRGQVFERFLDRAYRSGATHVGREEPADIAKPDGTLERVYLNFVYAPLRRPDGSVDGILVIAFDVTEQVLARLQIDDLRSAAEAANRAKDEFFAVLGHELRNPLAPIFTALELMRMQGAGTHENERRIIERQAQHLVRLVDDLLDVSRIARGKVELRRERVELAGVLGRAVEMTLPLIEERQHELVVDVAPGLLIDADVVRLAQAFANLLVNAARYTRPGGHIAVRATTLGSEVEVAIRDDGVGISSETLPHVFEVFVQERQALDRSAGGLGLGLAIVKGIVELHGGGVTLRSEGPGSGTEVTVRLPMAVAAAGTTPQGEGVSISTAAASPEGLTILVVDDNRDAADLLASQLATSGHHACVAYDAAEALRLAAEQPPHVALLDIGLPVMDGYELARRLRGLPGLSGLPLVAITGYGTHEDRTRSEEAGFDAHLTKPVAGEQLADVVRSLAPTSVEGAGEAPPG